MSTSRVIQLSEITQLANSTGPSKSTELSNSTERSGNAALCAPTDPEREGELTIDCDCCALRNTDACDDCIVSFLLEREPDDAVVIDADEARALRMLERAGLVPTLRFSAQTG